MKRLTRHPLMMRLSVFVVACYARLIFATNRVRIVSQVPPQLAQGPAIMAAWHQQLTFLPLIWNPRRRPLVALISASRDGRFIGTLARYFGIAAATGSSSRGAVSGTRELLRMARNGKHLFITPDGPRGPAFHAKPGATHMARLTGLPLIPCAAWCTRGINLGSWDEMRVPLPFGTIIIAYGNPAATLSPQELTKALNALTAQAHANATKLDTPATSA